MRLRSIAVGIVVCLFSLLWERMNLAAEDAPRGKPETGDDTFLIDEFTFTWTVVKAGDAELRLEKTQDTTRIVVKGGTSRYLFLRPEHAQKIGDALQDVDKYYANMRGRKAETDETVKAGEYEIKFRQHPEHGFSVWVQRTEGFEWITLDRKAANAFAPHLRKSVKMAAYADRVIEKGLSPLNIPGEKTEKQPLPIEKATTPKPAESEAPQSKESKRTTKDFRMWTDSAGRKMEAEFRGLDSGNATLRKTDGTPLSVPLEGLSEGDRQWILHRTEVTNSIGMKMVLIPAGEFVMGAPDSDTDVFVAFAKPQHRVRITKAFYLGVYEVTQEQYEKVMGANPSSSKESGARAPVERVSWEDAQEFCKRLSALPQEQAAGRRYRLPTEAEWEYACRAGSKNCYCFGDDAERLGEYAWYEDISGPNTLPVGERTFGPRPVGQKKPNAWGLHDMHGNVAEWCEDWFDMRYYVRSLADDPTGPTQGSTRVHRGGGCSNSAAHCRSAARGWFSSKVRYSYVGFRVAAVLSGK